MLSEEQFRDLIKRVEWDNLDYKAEGYDFSRPGVRNEFIKDVVCLANTPRETTAFIVLGIRWTAANGAELIGLGPKQANTVGLFRADTADPWGRNPSRAAAGRS